MIGVIAKQNQAAIVEEFFELFKTPWEFCRPGRFYEVVVATTDETHDPPPSLLITYRAERKKHDPNSVVADGSHPGGMVIGTDGPLPLYGNLLTFKAGQSATVCLTADVGVVGIRSDTGRTAVMRLGYDLFEEVRYLLSIGQPVENAHIAALDLHIALLRKWILDACIPLVEILPSPAGHAFAVCLTHDIDFVGIRRHKLDHTMWGFLYRSTVGAVWGVLKGRIPVRHLLKSWRAAASLPFVYLGWVKDFWEPFAWYLKIEENLPATYYLIPFKRRPGERVTERGASRRAAAYDISDVQEWATRLEGEGCEVGVHGIDAWHSLAKGREELARIRAVTGEKHMGIRMHWLLRDTETASTLEASGYSYDSTVGYNETVGYRAGTSQVFRPLGVRTLLELPMHIQDGALFFSNKLDLSEPDAEERCKPLIADAQSRGGVLTVLWHDRSHGPERFWGDFYVELVRTLKSLDPWFGTASQIVGWFRKRREVRFGEGAAANGNGMSLLYAGGPIEPPLRVRLYRPPMGDHVEQSKGPSTGHIDIAWNGRTPLDVDRLLKGMSNRPSGLPRTGTEARSLS
jgi:hypothetical protein